ncbi:MAG TPA: PIG-L family deacetylase [Planctomycetaceae bacterium]|jgi:LmbE family N-acetylglucosaminyl deacetylase|nr:PIG-L family deacetylase [Planctomycetaceae bacterium]
MAGTDRAVRILAIHAHPDDIELQCAGTLALLKDRGCHITVATMTAGDCGSAELGQAEIAKVRRGEAQASARLLGADCMCLEFSDLCISHDNDSRRRVTEAVRRARPDLVITAPPVDYMSDHELTSRLVRDACFAASVPNYTTRQWDPAPVLTQIPHLYYVDAIEGIDYFGRSQAPQFIVDITSTFELKLEMLACHASQRNWLLKQHGMDEYLESCRKWSAKRGGELGVAYGEAFCQHTGHPYPHDNRLLELLAPGS